MPTTKTDPSTTAKPDDPRRKMTPDEIHNRQQEELRRLEQAAEQDKPEEARSALIDALRTSSDIIRGLEARISAGESLSQELRTAQDEQREMTVELIELTNRAIERRNPGRNSELRWFDDENVAARFALEAIAGSGMSSRVSGWRERMTPMLDELRKADSGQTRSVAEGEDQTRDALTGLGGAGAGFSIPEHIRTIIGTVPKFTRVFEQARVIPLPAAAKVPIHRRGMRARGFRVGRGSPVPETTLGDPIVDEIEPQEFGCLTFVHRELLADNNLMPAIGDLILEDFADSIAQLLERDVVLGVKDEPDTGLDYNPGNHWFNGFLNSPLFAAQTIQSGTTFASITFEDLDALIHALDERFLSMAGFHIHRSLLARFSGERGTDGQFVWQPAALGEPATLRGYPYVTWRSMPSTGATVQADKPFIAFGDMKRAYVVGTRRAFQFDESTHYRFPERLVGMMGVARYGGSPWEPESLVIGKTNA